MICPKCGSKNEMAYSVLSNGLICLDPHCSFEVELSAGEALIMAEAAQELVCA